MKNRKNVWISLGLMALLIIIASGQLLASGREDDGITRDDMKTKLESTYAGSVTSIQLVEEAGQAVYQSTLQGKNGTYQISSDAHSGRVMRITPLHINPTQSATAEQVAPAKSAKPQASGSTEYGISLDQARAIAMEQVEGVFDGVEVEEVNQSVVYEVEIDTPKGQEVKVQVDAHTGKIVSVLWED